MSFTSIFKALPEALRHPAGMAMIGSFAFHGALFAGAPLLPGSSQAISSERLVRLIQLSPAERNRLPQASSSTTPIPPLPPSDLSSLVLPPLGELPDFSNQPNLGSLNPSSSGSPSIDISPGQSLPSGPSISIPKPVARPNIVPPPPNSITPPPTLGQQLSDLEASPPLDFSENNSPLPPGSAPANSSAAETPEILNQWIASARKVSGDPKLEFQNTTIPFNYPKAACKERAEGLAFVGVLVRPNGEKAREPELLGRSGNKTLDDAAVTAVKNHRFGPKGQYQAFLPSFEYKYSDQVCSESTTAPTTEGSNNPNQPPATPTPSNSSQSTPQKISITSVYPKAACAERLQGSTSVAATVKPNSQEAENVRLVSPSRYQTLNQAAIEDIKGRKFNSTAQEQNLELNYQFRYSEAACPQEAPSPSRSSTGDSEETTPKSSQKRSSSSKRSQDSPAPSSSQKKPSQPAQGSSSSKEPAQESSSSEEPASEGSSDSKEPAQESSDAEETTAP